MGTMIDFAYRFEGGAKDLAKARAAIEAYQEENAEASGNGGNDFEDEPVMGDDGAMEWSCYSTCNVDDFERTVEKLTENSSLRIFAYWACSDGCYESGLNLLEHGRGFGIQTWEADIGLNAARTVQTLKVSADEASALALIETFGWAMNDGWDEDHYPWLLRAKMVASELMRALAAHPSLAEAQSLRSPLLEMEKPLKEVREDLKKIADFGKASLAEVDQLLSAIERLQLGL